MTLEIKKNKSIDLDIPEFLCDSGLGDHLNKYDMLSHFNKFCFTAFIGKPGSGKTSLLVSMLTGKKDKRVFRKVFNHILLVMPESSRKSIKSDPFKDHHPEKMFEDLDLPTIENIYSRLKESSSKNETTLLLLDDVGASLKNNEIQKTLRKIIFNRRHLKCQIIILLQSFTSIPREVRKLFNSVIMFKPSKLEFQYLFDELFETKKDLAMDIMNLVYDEPHQYLMLNVDSQKLYKKFDEIVVNKNNLT